MDRTACRRPFLPYSIIVTWIVTLLPTATVLGQDEVKINTRRLSERVLVTWACDHFQGTNMAVLVSQEGLVLIDSGLSPTTVRRQREIIEQELGRSDFRYIINTHVHNDHAFANEVFPEATVIAHENGIAAMKKEVELIPELIGRLRNSRESYREWVAAVPADSLEGRYAREGLAAFDIGIADLEAGIEPRYPTLTFSDHHTLDLGDMRIELFAFSGLHSEADILILVPGERMLFTGDAFWGGQLPLLKEEMAGDFLQLMDNWEAIYRTCPDLKTMVPGHSDTPLTIEQFRAMYEYLARLWSDVQEARDAGTPLEMFLMRNVFSERYPEVADFNFIRGGYNFHQHNIYILWQLAGR